MVFGFWGGWWMSGRAIKPISKITVAAEKIASGDLTERIDVSETESELGQLSRVLNDTFEKLEKSFEQQARFTADASHELRTPISVMLTQIQLARSKERSVEEYQRTLETCERAVERMRTLVNQMLQLARMDIGDQTLMLDNCDLARVANEALEFIEPIAVEKKARLTRSLQPVRMKADVMKLGQVLTNLLNNSLLHNVEGTEISLSVESRNGKAIIQVADNGIGIPEEALPHLFERFYRVDKARSRGKGSSGLGLAICRRIVEAHRGTIRAESPPGKGAVFTIELPLNPSSS
jgi:heavy metal sensor kinase